MRKLTKMEAAKILGSEGGKVKSEAKSKASRENWKKFVKKIKIECAKKRVHLECLICGEKFDVQPYRAKTARTCSVKCRQTFIARKSNKKRSAKQRFTGSKENYVKFKGRHIHRFIMEQKLGRSLKKGEVVHHIDGNKWNNDINNLAVMTQADHARIHIKETMKHRWGKR